MLCANESNEMEPNVSDYCVSALAHLCHILIQEDLLGEALEAVRSLAGQPSISDPSNPTATTVTWKAKVAVLEFLQVNRGSDKTL